VFGFNAQVENSKSGFVQLGYNTTFGASLGLGVNLTPYATIAYTIERGFGNASIFGNTHEFTLAYNFSEPVRRPRSRAPKVPKSKRKLPERKELSKAEKLVALQEAREAQKNKLLALEEARSKADELRETQAREAEERIAATELVQDINGELELNDIESALNTFAEIENNKYVPAEDKESIGARLTEKIQLAEDIAQEETAVTTVTEEENKARALLTQTRNSIANSDVESATASLESILTSKYISDAEKQELQSSLNRIIEEKRVVVAQAEDKADQEKASELIRVTNELLANNNLEEAEANAALIRQNKFIPNSQKQQILQRITTVVKEKEDKEKASILVRITNEALASNNVEEAQAQAELIRQKGRARESFKFS